MADERSSTNAVSTERTASTKPVQSIEVENEVKEEDEAEEGSDRDGANEGAEAEEDNDGRPVSNTLYRAFKNITDVLLNHKIKVKFRGSEEEHFPSTLFKRLPNKRNLPDYYEVIKDPSAISTLKGKIQRKTYSGVPEFIRDFALIVHNAQIYNKPNSAPVRDVLRLEALFKEELQKLVEQGSVKEEDTAFPDLGEIPYATPEPDPVDEDEEEADDEPEEDEEDEEGDDSDDDKRKKRRRGARPSISSKKQDREEDDEGEKGGATEEQKRRGRPPKVDTPIEARIKAILKGIRKMKNDDNQLIAIDFERLPDKTEHAVYYQVIKEPIALDMIKKKAKRKKYDSVDSFMQDIELMFNNAMLYNEDGSALYNNAQTMLDETKKLADAEKAKPDEEYLMQDGRLPLPFIEYKNQIWKIGDWVHIQNPNDVTKPIVAQIYRTWQDENKQKWINACWYYRPEQTIHQYEKHFWEKEVVKTGQYRDHHIEEALDKCFVMFFTRYGRGRPRDIGSDCEVYVCEARYNEDKSKFNKIKTWASCLPDEVRDKDYEMDLFDVPKRIKKQPSPLLKDPSLLESMKEEEKADDPIPEPQWGHANAPPIVGGIYKRPRDENQSPPPEPTPPPPPTPPPVVRQPSSTIIPNQQHRPSIDRQASAGTPMPSQISRPSPSITPSATPYPNTSATPTASYSRPQFNQSGMAGQFNRPQSQTPSHLPTSYTVQPQVHQPTLSAAHPGSYTAATPVQAVNRPTVTAYQPQPPQYTGHSATSYDQRRKEVYVLSDQANAAIPEAIRNMYPQDDHGRVLFFDKPPMDTRHVVEGRFEGDKGKQLKHSERYVEAKKERDRLIAERKRQRDAQQSADEKASKRLKPGFFNEERDADGRIKADPTKAAQMRTAETRKVNELEEERLKQIAQSLKTRYLSGIRERYETDHGKDWERLLWRDLQRGSDIMEEGQHDQHAQALSSTNAIQRQSATRIEQYRQKIEDNHKNGLIKDFWTAVYLDDVDPRLP